jgi:hypothetical protein
MVLNPIASAMADKIGNFLGGILERDRPHEAAVDLDPTRSKPAPATKFPADPGFDQKLVKIGARIVRHGCYVVFQLTEVAVPRALFAEILRRIDELRPGPPLPA